MFVSGRRRVALVVAAAAALIISVPAQAQKFPDRTVKVIVPYVAGGGTDVTARAISQRADLFLLDEPDNHLDTGAKEELWRCIDELRKAGKTIFAAVHQSGEGIILPDRVMVLEFGRLAEQKTPGPIDD